MKAKTITVSLSAGLIALLKRLAKAENRSLSNFVENKLSKLCR